MKNFSKYYTIVLVSTLSYFFFATGMSALGSNEFLDQPNDSEYETLTVDFESSFAALQADPIDIVNPEDRADMQRFPQAFNIDDVAVDWMDYTFYAFDGSALRRVENPDKSAGNDSDFVLEYKKSEDGQPWAGLLYHLEEAVYSTNETVFRINVWSPRDGIEARLKLETLDDQNSTGDRILDVSLAEEWNTLEWDLSDANQEVAWERVVFIMDLDVDGPPQGGARDTWYLDDFELSGVEVTGDNGDPVGPDEPIVYEAPDSADDLTPLPLEFAFDTGAIDWEADLFHPFEGAGLTRIANPDQNGENENVHVLEYIKSADGQPWTGFFYHLKDTVQTTNDSQFSLKVWSPRSDIQGLMKLESRDGSTTGDLFSDITVSGEWAILEWDLSGVDQEVNWDMVTVIMDLDTDNPPAGGEMDTWYLDDFALTGVEVTSEPGEPGEPGLDLVRIPLPVDFEDQSIDWDNVFLGFEGAHVDVIENPHQDEDNDSDFVGRMVKDADIYWAGAFFLTEETFWFDEENNSITMDVWSPRPNVGINLKLEQSDGDAEFDSFAVTSTSGEWETMTWDYSGASPLIDWDQITMIFDFHVGQDGDGGPDWTWYFDNIDVNFADPDGDRPVGPATPADLHPISLPLDFEDDDFNWDFAFFGFEGGHASRVENPDVSDANESNWVGRMVKGSGPFWAGAFMHVDEPFTINEETPYFSMKVWSPRDGVPILMKIEQQEGDLEFETTQTTSTSEEWEVVTWDMSGAGFTDDWDVVVLIFDFREAGVGDGSENFTWYFDGLEVNVDDVATSSEDLYSDTPRIFDLHQNYPNPFNPTTQIQFDVPEQAGLRLEVFNVTGQRVAVLANSTYQPGRHTVTFDASNLASGIYFYRLHTGSFVQTEKMMLIK